jgi:uncharacterized integral membrane protein
MNKLFKIVGIVSGLVLTLMFVIVNLTITHVDLFVIEGDTWVFMVIMGSFVAGYLTCLLLTWLKRVRKSKKSSDSLERSLVGEI